MSLDFTAIDFETANPSRASVCSVGLAKVRDGRVVDTTGWPIRPPAGHGEFAPFHVHLHGITPEAVQGAPSWGQALDRIVQYLDGDLVVAHNAAFDLSVLRQACVAETMSWPSLDFLCSLMAARRTLKLPSYRLPFALKECGITMVNHHNAESDAAGAATLLAALADRTGATGLPEFAQSVELRLGHMETGFYTPPRWTRPNNGLTPVEADQSADPDGPLYGRTVVFTGTLASMTRQEAWDMTARAGGTAERGVTRRTQVLVAGDLNPATFAPGATTTQKVTKAFQLQDGGQDIEVMTEADFLAAITPADATGGNVIQMDEWLASDDDAAADASPFYGELAHPGGRSLGGDPCVACHAPIPSEAFWVWRDRHVCSMECNLRVKRWYKRWIAKGRPPTGWLPV